MLSRKILRNILWNIKTLSRLFFADKFKNLITTRSEVTITGKCFPTSTKKIVGTRILYCNMYKIQLIVQFKVPHVKISYTKTFFKYSKTKKKQKKVRLEENLEQSLQPVQATDPEIKK